ncbi:hypothetical protein Enr13x_38130 [Stieleria neptunia]|uniref:Uncharacterized protein n=1 Tax=Stieleria neptunia TaxID=2527979 RepID=A0A518HSX3_9BACT|nr:hypothetical protein [Stieleria neptunia]QDV43953.1 hypothetical protein Enr13x_38130 [Stieleria neptunia]
MDPIDIHAQKKRLTLELDQGIYDYLNQAIVLSRLSGTRSLPQHLPFIIESQLHDGSLESVKLGIQRVRRHVQWRHEIVAELMQILLVALTNDVDAEIMEMIDTHLPGCESRIPSSAEVLPCFSLEPRGRAPRPNALVPVQDTAFHEVTIEIDGITFGLLSIEARKMNFSAEELALHLLHNFRDESAIREQCKELSRVESDLRRLHMGIRNLVFAVVLKQAPASEHQELEQRFRELIREWGQKRCK